MPDGTVTAIPSTVTVIASALKSDPVEPETVPARLPHAAVPPPGVARSDWQILARLGQLAGMDWDYGDPAAIAAAIGAPQAAAMGEAPEGKSGQAYGGGWATWLQRRGFIHIEDHTKQV